MIQVTLNDGRIFTTGRVWFEVGFNGVAMICFIAIDYGRRAFATTQVSELQ